MTNIHLPMILLLSGLEASLRHFGTNTVMSMWPRIRNQSTQILMPRQENVSLLPWLMKKSKRNKYRIIRTFKSVDDECALHNGDENHLITSWPHYSRR